MKRFIYLLVALIAITTTSCDTDLHEVENPQEEMTVSEQQEILSDTTAECYHIIVDEEKNRIDIYNSDGEIVYKDCVSKYDNDFVTVPAGWVITIILTLFLFGFIVGISMD